MITEIENILGKNENDTESNNNGDKENKIIEKKINYDDFINVKNKIMFAF